MAQSHLLSGSIHRSLWLLALPAMGSSLSLVVFDLANAYWVGLLGADALAALTASAFVIWAIYSLGQGLSTGLTAIIARRLGEGHQEQAIAVCHQGLVLMLLFSLILFFPVWGLSGPLFALMDPSPEVLALGLPYLRLNIYGLVTIVGFVVLEAIFVGQGDTRTPMALTAGALGLNMLLDPLLIFGWGPMPGLGLQGAAWGSMIGRACGLIWGVRLLAKKGWLHKEGLRQAPNFKLALKAFSIGMPHAISGLVFCLVFIGLTPMLTHFGTEALAAMGVGQRIETLVYAVMLGLSVAATSLVGQNLGAGQSERAEAIAWTTCLYASGLNLCFMGIFIGLGPWLIPLFSENALVISHGQDYLFFMGLALIPFGFEMVLQGAFGGAGDTLPPMIIVVLGTTLRIPLALYLAFDLGLGVWGVWWAIGISMALKGIIIALWFKRGRWKQKIV